MYTARIEKMINKEVGVRGSSDARAVVFIYVRTQSNSAKYDILELQAQDIF